MPEQKIEQSFQDLFGDIFVDGERRLAESLERTAKLTNLPPEIRQQASDGFVTRRNEDIETAVKRLSVVDSEGQKRIEISALERTIGFWQNSLQDPKLPVQRREIGESRLSYLQTRHEQLTKPPQSPRG